MLLTGKQVKELAAARGWLLVKFLPLKNLDGTGFGGYKYKYGLNIPAEPLDLSTRGPGGLYFTYVKKEEKNQWADAYAYQVSVPDDAGVYFDESEVKFKASALLIEREWKEEYRDYIHLNSWWLTFIEQTEEICLSAVKECVHAINYVKDQTPAICLAAVQEYSHNLTKIKKQTPEICLVAVQQNGQTLQYVREQTPEICIAAVRQCGLALRYVKEQTPEICLVAVQQDGWMLEYVKEQTPEICLAAVQQDGFALRYVKEQTPEICLAAVQQDGCALKYVKEQTPEICLAAAQQDALSIEEQSPGACPDFLQVF